MLIDPTSAEDVELIAVRANNAPEMKLKLEQALANANAERVWDLQLVGNGAAPTFLALITLAGAEGATSPNVAPGNVSVATATAIDPIELAEQITAELIANGSGENLWKAVSAGGGFGPHWMSVAFYTEAQE